MDAGLVGVHRELRCVGAAQGRLLGVPERFGRRPVKGLGCGGAATENQPDRRDGNKEQALGKCSMRAARKLTATPAAGPTGPRATGSGHDALPPPACLSRQALRWMNQPVERIRHRNDSRVWHIAVRDGRAATTLPCRTEGPRWQASLLWMTLTGCRSVPSAQRVHLAAWILSYHHRRERAGRIPPGQRKRSESREAGAVDAPASASALDHGEASRAEVACIGQLVVRAVDRGRQRRAMNPAWQMPPGYGRRRASVSLTRLRRACRSPSVARMNGPV